MTDQLPILRSRQPATHTPPPRAELSERMTEAKALATAGDLIPKEYRNNPGACLLVMDWSESHGVALFDAMGHVAFFNGKATVEARLQRAMAARAGYFTRVTAEGDEPGHEYCTVAVYDSAGTELGSYTMTHAKAMLLDVYQRNANYKKALDQMLLARATTRALDRYATAPTLVGVFADDEETDLDPVQTIQPTSTPTPLELVEDVELVEPWDIDALKKELRERGITQADALYRSGCMTIKELAQEPAIVDTILNPPVEQPAMPTLELDESPF